MKIPPLSPFMKGEDPEWRGTEFQSTLGRMSGANFSSIRLEMSFSV